MCTTPSAMASTSGSPFHRLATAIVLSHAQNTASSNLAPNDPRRRLIAGIAGQGGAGLGSAAASPSGASSSTLGT